MRSLKIMLLFVCGLLLTSVSAMAQGFMHAENKKVIDIDGNEIILRGHAPGGWMIQEPYMMQMEDFCSSQHEIRKKIENVLGKENTEEFYKKWLENGFRREDVKLLAEMGFNSIRLPLHYNILTLPIEEEPVSGENTWKEEGFKLVDDVLSWCKEFKIYLILDMHGTPGGQGMDSAISDYDSSKPSLWESQENKDKLVALWVKLADRYANEQYIGGYDLINEPNWAFDGSNKNGCNENSNTQIWSLYKRIITAVREVDKNHMMILEGNCWCNNFNGLPNVKNWDENLCLEFHKYWTVNDQGSINFIVNLRNSKGLPIWCGESGENSNKWYTDAVKLFEQNGIGWSWWTWKKIGSVNGICTVKAPSGYSTLKSYWKNGGSKPSVDTAKKTMMDLADAYLLENCSINYGVADALLRQPHTDELKPFAENMIPGKVFASNYDMGTNGVAYLDLDGVETTHSTAGDYTAWNQGWAYRADGVDIETCSDSGSNGYSVGWVTAGEWMKYTIDVDETAAYKLIIRYATTNTNTKIAFEVDGAAITTDVALASTGGWSTWKSVAVPKLILSKGKHVLKVTTVEGGANLIFFQFATPSSASDVEFKAISAKTSEDGKDIFLSVNKDLDVSNFSATDFEVKSDNETLSVESVQLSATSAKLVDIKLASKVYLDNNVTLSYNGSSLKDVDGNALAAFSDMVVTNVSEKRAKIPGKINVEDYYDQSGLSFETCDDTGGGSTNFGYTDPGDYVDFLVDITQTADYTFQFRIAAQNAGGKFELQLFDEDNNKKVIASYAVGATGGWQTWKTQTAKASLPKGNYRLRIYIVSKEFNMNWFSFTNPTGIGEVLNESKNKVTVYDLSGKMIYNKVNATKDDLPHLPSGTYIIKAGEGDSEKTQKIVVK